MIYIDNKLVYSSYDICPVRHSCPRAESFLLQPHAPAFRDQHIATGRVITSSEKGDIPY
jgi:hypothetical protein